LVIHDGTWTYKIPTVDNIPKEFNVEMFNSAPDKKRVLSSKGKYLLTMFHPLSTFSTLMRTSSNSGNCI
jgi:xanthine dehydrogenase molybdopterin-binding subunit B